MPHDGSIPVELAKYRLNKALGDLVTAKINLENEKYEASANRSYYAIFHATRALLAMERVDYKRHSGLISHFQKQYIKTGVFDIEYGKIIMRAFEIRHEADYEDFYILSKEDAAQQLINAEKFTDAVKDYLKKQV